MGSDSRPARVREAVEAAHLRELRTVPVVDLATNGAIHPITSGIPEAVVARQANHVLLVLH